MVAEPGRICGRGERLAERLIGKNGRSPIASRDGSRAGADEGDGGWDDGVGEINA